MDTEQLKTFLEVSRTRHFGRAAHNLFLSQSAVSSRIQTLEEQVGATLFTRTRNDIQLTAAGERLLHHAEGILASWNYARQDVLLDDRSQYSLAIAGVPSLWDITLQKWVHTLHRQLPQLALHAEVLDADTLMRRLLEGTLNLGFSFEAPQLAQLNTEQIGIVSLIMVSSHANINSSAAIEQDYVSVDWGLSFDVAHARHFPNARAARIRLPLGRIALEYLLECGGSAYLAEPMVQTALDNNLLFRVDEAPVIERPAYAIFANKSERTELIQQALNLLA